MNTIVNFEIAKLLKDKGFSWECVKFYKKSKYDKDFHLSTGIEYDSDKDCVWDWNLNGGKSGVLLKTIPYPNDDTAIYYSAPAIAEVVMWLYEKHNIWIWTEQLIETDSFEWYCRYTNKGNCRYNDGNFYNTPTEAYTQAILKTLKEII